MRSFRIMNSFPSRRGLLLAATTAQFAKPAITMPKYLQQKDTT